MKKCPQCQTEYFDRMLEFCLEDGTRLAEVGNRTAAQTEVLTAEQRSVETMFFNERGEVPKTSEVSEPATVNQPSAGATEPVASLKQKTVEKGYRALEIGTLVGALAHNWWQWLYVDRQHYGSVSGFLLSADFLIWFMLLATGTGAGLLTLKFSKNKALAYAGLVVLAVNFLLLLVPRR